jgi:thymidylate synthase (FAD)
MDSNPTASYPVGDKSDNWVSATIIEGILVPLIKPEVSVHSSDSTAKTKTKTEITLGDQINPADFQPLIGHVRFAIPLTKPEVSVHWMTPRPAVSMVLSARVSSTTPDNEDLKLLTHCWKNGHFSVFEMANLCIRVKTSRAIGRQLLRHRNGFQEASQRYAEVENLDEYFYTPHRVQAKNNRQRSLVVNDDERTTKMWKEKQEQVWILATDAYKAAIKKGVAREVARSLLPEGMTPTIMFINGTLRNWLTYLNSRADPNNGAQEEHVQVAQRILVIFKKALPEVYEHCGLASIPITTMTSEEIDEMDVTPRIS